jgi:hypothetical protein
MLRSIADIARFYGENLRHGNTKTAPPTVLVILELKLGFSNTSAA